MVVLGVKNGTVECLEASASNGELNIRSIPTNKILGVRYFEKKQEHPPHDKQSGGKESPFITLPTPVAEVM